MFVVDLVPKIDSKGANRAIFFVLLVRLEMFLCQVLKFQDSVIEAGQGKKSRERLYV